MPPQETKMQKVAHPPEGNRVRKTGVVADVCGSNATRDYVYDLTGHWLMEANSDANGCFYNIFVANRHVFSFKGQVNFSHTDWLGTERSRVWIPYDTHQLTSDTCTSLPFGDALTCTVSPANYSSTLHFTGKERDSESGLDDFGARYYSSAMGRFTSPDWSAVPSPVPYGNLTNPQTLNLYALVADNPETFADLDGHYEFSSLLGGLGYGGIGGCGMRAFLCGEVRDPDKSQAQNQNQDQTQQNQLTQNSQQSTTQQPATSAQSGINPNYKLPTFDTVLKNASDFSAGAGDCLTGRCLFLGTSLTEKARQLNGADSVVDKGSGAYLGGKITGAAVGTGIVSLAAANAVVGLESKVAIHAAHHAFEYLGGARLAHIQIIFWIAGQKGSDLSVRIPLPWK